jgi:uncharacterized protein (DUF305 family)
MFKIEHNVETNEIKQIELTKEEIIEVNRLAIEVEKRQKISDKKMADNLAEAEAKATSKAALLDRLGITAEEAALLLS